MGIFSNPGMMLGLAKGIQGGTENFYGAQEKKRKANQDYLESMAKQRMLELQGKEIEAKAESAAFDNYGKGLQKDASGVIAPMEGYQLPDPSNPANKLSYWDTQVERKRKQEAKDREYSLVNALKAQQAFRSGKTAPGDELINIPSTSFDEFLKTPVPMATLEQQERYKKLTKAEIPPGMTQKDAETLIARYAGQEGVQNRFEESQKTTKGIHAENIALNKAKAIEDSEKAMAGYANSMGRMNEVISQSQKINPSGIDYWALKAKAIGNSFDPLGVIPKLNPEESQRMAFYSGLTQDSIAKMFESGGKALTDTEQRLSKELAITATDTNQQILAKAQRLQQILASKFEQESSPAERILPGVSGKYKGKISSAQKEIQKKTTDASQRVRVIGPKGEKGTMSADEFNQFSKKGWKRAN